MSIISHYQNRYEATLEEEFSLQEYLDLCREDASVYASAAERMLLAIGEPELVDTSRDPRLSRIFANKVIKRYEAFREFYGMEECIQQIVSFFRHAAQGLEEQIPSSSLPAGTKEGINDWGRKGYGGPCPPVGHGPHRYVFTLYALAVPDLPAAAGVPQTAAAAVYGFLLNFGLGDGVLAQASFEATYER